MPETKGRSLAQIQAAFRPTGKHLDKQRLVGAPENTSTSFGNQLRPWEEQLSEDRDLLYFAVIDEGPGIPQAVLTKIFEPFTTGLSEATAGEQGTGLGLSIVKHIIEAHANTYREAMHFFG